MIELLSGNEAIARGAYEAGVTVATGYPGTPATEILAALARFKSDVYCEWSPNEKVACEVAAGAALAGARVIVTMKHVGLNVAADPLLTLSYLGVEGGFVLCVADDPGMHSSPNEQDTRHYARLAKIPLFEPADSQEACEFVGLALDLSERFRTPVMLRSTTRVSHAHSTVTLGTRRPAPRAVGFTKNPARYVPIPCSGRAMRRVVEERLTKLALVTAHSPANRIEWRDRGLGILTASVAYQYVREVWPEASVLKLGCSYPFPDVLIREFAAGVERVLVVEELDDILEQHVKAMGIFCCGRDFVPGVGELSPTILQSVRARIEGRAVSKGPAACDGDLPARPPVLCPGCPHRGILHALGQQDVVVTGDIGCSSLGALEPLGRVDALLCTGASISLAHGLQKAGESRKVVGLVGDSTFFHSGLTGLLELACNQGTATIIVMDNRTTALTGHQPHPGTGRTLMGRETAAASIADIGRACGIRRVREVNPYDLTTTQAVLSEEISADEPSLIVSVAPCPLHARQPLGPQRRVAADICQNCGRCLRLGCPALEAGADAVRVNEYLCGGCGLCEQVCSVGAITPREAS